MSHALPVLAAIVLCLAAAGILSWDLYPLLFEPRARGYADAARPALPAREVGISARLGRLRRLETVADGGGGRALIQARPSPDPAGPLPRNGVYRGKQPRLTPYMIICDPAVTPVVPGFYRHHLAQQEEGTS